MQKVHGWAHYTNVKAASVVVWKRKNTYCKTISHSYRHLRGQNQQLGITVLPESFLFLIYAILTLIGMER